VSEKGVVIGFLVPDAHSGPPPAAPGRLVDVGAIRKVLAAEKITPRQGPVDSFFEAASHNYKNKEYAAAIPNLEKTLQLFPGQAIAAANLADAKAKVAAGTPGASPSSQGSPAATPASTGGFPWLLMVLVVVVVVLVAIAALLLVRRRRGREPTPAGGLPTPPRTPRPREGQPAPASRPAAGGRSGQASADPAVPGAGAGGVAVMEGGGSSPSRAGPLASGAPSQAVAGHAPAPGARDASRRAARVSPAPSAQGAASGRSAFCTSCGSPIAPQHRFCGRCGAPAG
jgi:hypothetical protein